MILTNEEIMRINQTAEFDSAIGYARKIEEAAIESYKAELLNEVGEPVGWILNSDIEYDGTTHSLTTINVLPANFDKWSAFYTSDQVAAAIQQYKDSLLKDVGEPVGQGLFDAEGKCYAIGQHKSSVCIGGKSFKSQPLFTESQLLAAVAKKDEEIAGMRKQIGKQAMTIGELPLPEAPKGEEK